MAGCKNGESAERRSLMLGRRSLVTFRVKTVSKEQRRPTGVEEFHHRFPQFVVLDWLRNVVVEACLRSILDLFFHGICGQGHDRDLWIMVLLLPGANFAACVVAVLHGHLDIALEVDPLVKLFWRCKKGTFDLR